MRPLLIVEKMAAIDATIAPNAVTKLFAFVIHFVIPLGIPCFDRFELGFHCQNNPNSSETVNSTTRSDTEPSNSSAVLPHARLLQNALPQRFARTFRKSAVLFWGELSHKFVTTYWEIGDFERNQPI